MSNLVASSGDVAMSSNPVKYDLQILPPEEVMSASMPLALQCLVTDRIFSLALSVAFDGIGSCEVLHLAVPVYRKTKWVPCVFKSDAAGH